MGQNKADMATTLSVADNGRPPLWQRIMSVIRRDLVAADLKWSLFVAACQSYKHDSCLRPFPPMFLKDHNKDYRALTEAVESVPAFTKLELLIKTLPTVVIDLLHWVLVDLREPSLSVVDKSEVGEVLGLVACELSAPSPSLVVRLHYDPSSVTERKWAVAKQQHGSLHAFHGSKLENFHSILYYGLQQHLTKNALFGQGVYLSSELLVCLPYSRNMFGWANSHVATELSIVALCEVLDHPSVHCQSEGERSRARAEDSMAGEVPNKLYLVPNSSLLRVRHLLVYTTHITSIQRVSHCGMLEWLSGHKMTALLVAYAMMLVTVGLSRSPTVLRYWHQFCYSLGLRY